MENANTHNLSIIGIANLVFSILEQLINYLTKSWGFKFTTAFCQIFLESDGIEKPVDVDIFDVTLQRRLN